MKQSATLEASTTDSSVHFPPLSSSRTKSQTVIRFRFFPVLLVVFFSVTTGLSTTYPLKAGNNHRHINPNGLPSKRSGPLVTNQVVEEDNKKHVPIATEVVRSSDTTNSVITQTPEDSKLEEQEDDTTQTNDTADDDKETEKEKEKMNVPDDQKFKERILSSIRTVQNWETVEWLKACRETIPWDDLRNSTGPYSRPEQDRLLADDSNALFLQRLCRWFPKFMTWVNAPPCVKCGCKECEMKTVRGPETDEENEGNAKRVEVYYCPECKENTTTFPRYNKARKLLETRKGRCGEYSNLFGLFCRAVGFETRLVLDLSDHLWTEVRIGDNWIMADSCEGVIDKPSMYEYGWGKDGLCYMIAIASDHVVDVTSRYTRKFLTEDFQNRRRSHTTSENATARVLEELNRDLQQNLTKKAIEDLGERLVLEEAELQLYKQATEWTPQEKYGRGRISGSLAWKQSRQEAGTSLSKDEQQAKEKSRQVAGFQVESFLPPISSKLSLQVRPNPSGRHDGILVAGTACAVGEADSISVVVVDESYLGCILQSQSFLTWTDVNDFVNRLPSERIVLVNGKCEEDSKVKSFPIDRLGGWIKDDVITNGVAFIGQVDAHPDWVYCSTLENCPPEGYEVILQTSSSHPSMKLRTDRHTMPSKVAGRLPESVMPLKTQLLASDEQKKVAVTSFFQSSSNRFAAYTTKAGSPIYFLDSSSYPLVKLDAHMLQATTNGNTWSTFRFLPEPLVPEDDTKTMSKETGATLPSYDVPLETNFFNSILGTQLLSNNTTPLPTSVALNNSRLVGLYFSAHWCGPCRSFTPMLAEMYAHLKEERPSHGLEIVFVSSDFDADSFSQYFGTMPWQAIPFDQIQMVKSALKMTYGIQGIPSLVVLDAVTGQVVVPVDESRQAVFRACHGGDQKIEALLDSWLDRVPMETKEILSMLESSCQEDELNQTLKDDKENPYLLTAPKSAPPLDPAARIKDFFEKLVAEGNDPTSAAAKAIGLVAEEQKSGRKFNPGPLDGKAIRKGPVVPASGLDEAITRVIESNSIPVVRNAFNILMKYLANAASEPWSPKFRAFKLSNNVADQVVCLEGGLTLIQGLGFEIHGTSQEFKATVPVSMDIDATTRKLSELIKIIDEKQ